MNIREWDSSESAPQMLTQLWREHPKFLRTQIGQLHRFLIDCCWKYEHLIPQEGLRDGLRGAERYLAGDIGDDELDRLNYYAESEAFRIEYARSSEELADLEKLIRSIPEIHLLPFEEARALLLEAAYFAEGAMIYPRFDGLPWVDRLFESEFLCANLLRQNIKPPLQ